MQTADITRYAHSPYCAHGARAEVEAAQRARAAEQDGNRDGASTRRKIRNMIRGWR